jgi:FkbM family methyltransferase
MSIAWKQRIANWLASGINTCARLPGRRLYASYLDGINRRFNDLDQTHVEIVDGHELCFVCPNPLTRWRVETLVTKEPETLSWIRRFAAGAVMWDIGANVGLYSLYAARARGCRVIAFEPIPENFTLLVKNVQINGLEESVSALPIALGDSMRLDALHVLESNPGAVVAAFRRENTAAKARLACLGFSIDRFIADFSPPFPEHIKIAVDGSAQNVVRGAERTLADPRVRSVSIALDDQRADSWSTREALAQLSFYVVGAHRSPLFPLSPARNFHFLKR